MGKRFQHKPYFDYDPTQISSPVLRVECVRMLIGFAAKLQANRIHSVVKTAFLNPPINNNVIITFPKRIQIHDKEII